MGKGAAGALEQVQEQTVAERRALRVQYRQLYTETAAGKENLINDGAELQSMLQKVQALHSQVARPREHAVDAEVFAQLTECGLNLVKRGQAANQGRTPADLIRALRLQYVSDGLALSAPLATDAFDWAHLGAAASALHKAAPGVQCMRGPLDAEVKARRAVVRQPKRQLEAATRPEELTNIHEAEKQETDRHLTAMWRALSAAGPGARVPLGHLVCNHRSFAQTVENIFTLSFLVRDQRVRLLSDADAGLQVVAVSRAEKEAAAAAAAGGGAGSQHKPQQFMVSFTMQDWRLMKQLVEPGQCIMEHRAPQARDDTGPPSAAAAAAAAGPAAKRVRRAS